MLILREAASEKRSIHVRKESRTLGQKKTNSGVGLARPLLLILPPDPDNSEIDN